MFVFLLVCMLNTGGFVPSSVPIFFHFYAVAFVLELIKIAY